MATTITVRTAAGKTLTIDHLPTSTIQSLASRIAKEWPEYTTDRQRLIVNGKPLSNFTLTFEGADLKAGSVIHLVKKAGSSQCGGKPTSSGNGNAFRSVPPPSTTGQQVQVVVPQGAQPGQKLRIAFNGQQYDVQIPPNCVAGSKFLINIS